MLLSHPGRSLFNADFAHWNLSSGLWLQVPGKLVLVKAQLQPSAAGPAHGPLKEIHGLSEEPSDHYEAKSFSEFLGS